MVRTRPGSLAELFEGRPAERPEWIEYHMTRTQDLTSDDDDLFRVVTGGNLGVSRSLFEEVGGYDETFTQWGAEDTEFGYRAYTMGGLLVPARDALCWHQGAGAAPSQDELTSLDLQRAKISQLIAHHSFRKAASGRSFTVPQYVVTVQPGAADDQLATAEQVLANGIHDLVVWIADPNALEAAQAPDRELIRRLLDGDPRVRFGPSDGACAVIPGASFHISVPAGSTVKSTTVSPPAQGTPIGGPSKHQSARPQDSRDRSDPGPVPGDAKRDQHRRTPRPVAAPARFWKVRGPSHAQVSTVRESSRPRAGIDREP